jgi:hypothetical protein
MQMYVLSSQSSYVCVINMYALLEVWNASGLNGGTSSLPPISDTYEVIRYTYSKQSFCTKIIVPWIKYQAI